MCVRTGHRGVRTHVCPHITPTPARKRGDRERGEGSDSFRACLPASVPRPLAFSPKMARFLAHSGTWGEGAPADTVKKTVERNTRVFWKGPGPDDITGVALLVRESAE